MKLKIILILIPAIFFSQQAKNDFERGLELYASKKFLMAAGSFKKAIDSGFQNEKVYFYLGNSYAFIENYDKAIENLKMANELSENQKFKSLAIHNIGYVYYLKKDYKKCINYLNMAYSINTNLNQVFWYKGMAFYKLKDKDNTIIEWERYLELAPNGEESDNIRRALAILKSKDFSFEKDGDKIIVSDGLSDKDKKIDVLPLIDVEGVLEEIKPEDKGKVSDEALEEIEK
ncbi:MAG: hypothetical protein N2258_05710 [Brevinematales bacterium]|nr:hypothetical protein [Brevinematales bacterium]